MLLKKSLDQNKCKKKQQILYTEHFICSFEQTAYLKVGTVFFKLLMNNYNIVIKDKLLWCYSR